MTRTSLTVAPPLIEQLAKSENERHAYRLKEISSMSARLRLLQPVLEALKERYRFECNIAGIRLVAGGAIRIEGYIVYVSPRVHAALLELGFVEVERYTYASVHSLTLKKGRLKLAITVDQRATEPAL